MGHFVQQLRIALRVLGRAPTFSLCVMLILALGIGMAAAMFSILDAVLLQPLPVREQDRVILPTLFSNAGSEFPVSIRELDQLRLESRTLQDVAAMAHTGTVQGALLDGDRTVVLARAPVSGNYFSLLGARAALGRLLRPEDDVAGAGQVMVVSYDTWRREFGGDSSVIGRRLTDPTSGVTYLVVGVAPPGLDFPEAAGAWVALLPSHPFWVRLVGRLAPGATPAAAAQEVFSIVQHTSADPRRVAARARSLHDAVVGDVRPLLIALTAAVGLLLAIVCVNVGNLLLLRATGRSQELAVRRALGASSGQLVRQLMLESSLLGAAGGILGILCAHSALRALVALAPVRIPRADLIALSGAPVLAAGAISLGAVVGFGLAPALAAARASSGGLLRAGSASTGASRGQRRARQWLVASQMALALVMLTAAGLLVRSLDRLRQVDLGYEPDGLVVLRLSVPKVALASPQKLFALFESLEPELRAVPGVQAVTPLLNPPFAGLDVWQWQFEAEGVEPHPGEPLPLIPVETGGAEYFRTLGIPILSGRGFLERDREDQPPVVVVSEAVARRFWPSSDPIGRRIRVPAYSGGGFFHKGEWRTVVGVAGDIRYRSVERSTPTVYLPWRQSYAQAVFAVRVSSGGDRAPLAALRGAVRGAASDVDVWRANMMGQLLSEPLGRPRMATFLVSGFAAVALLLAAIGLYGVVASTVREQTREIGVRIALGATPGRVRRQVMFGALRMTAIGGALGTLAALAGSRLLTALLFDVSPTDPTTFVAAMAMLVLTGITAAYLPARRATRVDPSEALRSQ